MQNHLTITINKHIMVKDKQGVKMSNITNNQLIDHAREVLEEVSGTLWERLIEEDIKRNDLEALKFHVNMAEKELAIEEDNWL